MTTCLTNSKDGTGPEVGQNFSYEFWWKRQERWADLWWFGVLGTVFLVGGFLSKSSCAF